MHIAIVNQDATMQHLLKIIVEFHGHTAWIGDSFAFAQSEHVAFDMVFLEPGHELELARRRIESARDLYPDARCLLLSSYDESIQLAREYDVLVFLSPFSVAKLRSLLGPSIARKEAPRGPNYKRNTHYRNRE